MDVIALIGIAIGIPAMFSPLVVLFDHELHPEKYTTRGFAAGLVTGPAIFGLATIIVAVFFPR